jgi:uncharacterized protein YbjT (DUF2867 family)
MPAMKVLVTGATGVAGRSAVAALIRAGHHVSAVTRSAAKADTVRALGATPVEADLFDSGAARRAVARHAAFRAATGWAPTIPSAREGWPRIIRELLAG